MKRGTPDHPKTYDLAQLLGIPRAHAVGLLECLWHWARHYAIRGNVGRWSDHQIATGAGWENLERSGEFVQALVQSGWLDRDPVHRLLIHDIKDHADNTWRQNLDDAGLKWWDGSPPRKYTIKKGYKKLQKKSRKSPENSRKSPQPEPEPEPTVQPLPSVETVLLSNPVQSLPSVETSQTGVRAQNTVQSGKTEQAGSARSPTKALARPNGQPDDFDTFWALFCGAGISLNERDKMRTLQRWLSIADSERPKVLPWAVRMFKTKWRTHFTPMPYAALESEGWSRTKGPRLIPEPDQSREATFDLLEEKLGSTTDP